MMKKNLIIIVLFVFAINGNAQQVTNGPELNNDRDSKMNRMLDGDDNCFYTYRVRTKGMGTSFFIEKYNKDELKPAFSKGIDIDADRYTFVEDVKYSLNNVYIFFRQYDKREGKMRLFYRTVSADGRASGKAEEILNVVTDHYEFIDFDIYQNPSKTKFLVKASYKESKEDKYKTNFILYDVATMQKVFTKQVNQKLFSGVQMQQSFFGGFSFRDVDFVGLMLDDADNIFYGYTYVDKTSNEKNNKYKVAINIISANATDAKTVELEFDDNYYVGNIKFTKLNSNQIVAGGFLKDVIERRGPDLVKVGIFSFTVNIEKSKIDSKIVNLLDDKMLAALESNAKRSRYFKYKVDYIIPSGSSVYFVGEQYREQQITTFDPMTRMTQTQWEYEYMDVIVAKLSKDGVFEWIKNAPLRISMTLSSPHVFKQYIAVATGKAIYILNDEHEKNIKIYSQPDFEPRDLKNMSGIHGTNFVSSSVDLENGNIVHKLIFANENYCFAPIQERNYEFIPPPDTELFVKGKNNEIYIYTEDRGRDRFSKIKFE